MWSATVDRVLLSFFGEVSLFCVESHCNTWKIVCDKTPKRPEVIILANVILGPKSNITLYLLKALRNSPNRHCKKLKTLHFMAISSNTYWWYPMIHIKDSFT